MRRPEVSGLAPIVLFVGETKNEYFSAIDRALRDG
jgi:hypothetical protein